MTPFERSYRPSFVNRTIISNRTHATIPQTTTYNRITTLRWIHAPIVVSHHLSPRGTSSDLWRYPVALTYLTIQMTYSPHYRLQTTVARPWTLMTISICVSYYDLHTQQSTNILVRLWLINIARTNNSSHAHRRHRDSFVVLLMIRCKRSSQSCNRYLY